MLDRIGKVLFTSKDITDCVNGLKTGITQDCYRKCPIFIGVLKGCFVFLADPVRCVVLSCRIDFMAFSGYGDKAETSGVEISKKIYLSLPKVKMLLLLKTSRIQG